MQVVIARLPARQAVVLHLGLPDGISAPQALLGRYGVEAVRPGEFSFFVCFGHQAMLAVDVVGGFRRAALLDGLGDSSPKGVVAVAGFYLGIALPLACLCVANQPLCCAVVVVLCPLAVAFLAGVALRRVADGCIQSLFCRLAS